MRIELLYVDGCPGHAAFLPRLRQLVAEAGVDALVRQRRVESDEDAEAARFLGSPTLRIDGRDVDPAARERTDYGLTCRMYRTEEGLAPTPPDAWVRAALDGAKRRGGPWGAGARLIVGSTLVVLAIAYWRATWLDLLIGLVVLPAIATFVMFLRGRASVPLRLGAAGHLVTLAHIAATVSIVPDAAALFYGSMTLVAAVRGTGGCEITAVANWLRARDDQIGCPLFAPFDALDRRRRGVSPRRADGEKASGPRVNSPGGTDGR